MRPTAHLRSARSPGCVLQHHARPQRPTPPPSRSGSARSLHDADVRRNSPASSHHVMARVRTNGEPCSKSEPSRPRQPLDRACWRRLPLQCRLGAKSGASDAVTAQGGCNGATGLLGRPRERACNASPTASRCSSRALAARYTENCAGRRHVRSYPRLVRGSIFTAQRWLQGCSFGPTSRSGGRCSHRLPLISRRRARKLGRSPPNGYGLFHPYHRLFEWPTSTWRT